MIALPTWNITIVSPCATLGILLANTAAGWVDGRLVASSKNIVTSSWPRANLQSPAVRIASASYTGRVHQSQDFSKLYTSSTKSSSCSMIFRVYSRVYSGVSRFDPFVILLTKPKVSAKLEKTNHWTASNPPVTSSQVIPSHSKPEGMPREEWNFWPTNIWWFPWFPKLWGWAPSDHPFLEFSRLFFFSLVNTNHFMDTPLDGSPPKKEPSLKLSRWTAEHGTVATPVIQRDSF